MNDEAIRLMNEAEEKNPSGINQTVETKVEVAPQPEVKAEVQKTEPEAQQTNSEVDTPKEATLKKQKLGELIDLKRKARAISRELAPEDKAEVKVEEEAQKAEPFDQEAFRQQLLEEAKLKLMEEFRPKLDEVEVLREENERYRTEKAMEKLTAVIDKEVATFVKKYPQAELMIDKEYLVNLVASNHKLADLTSEELILKAYPNATRAPRMDPYGNEGRNQPKAKDFTDFDEIGSIKAGSKDADQYLDFLVKNR